MAHPVLYLWIWCCIHNSLRKDEENRIWSDVVKCHVVGSCFSCRTLISLRVLSLADVSLSLGQGCRSYYPEHAPSCSVQVGARSCWDPLLESAEGLRFCLVASDCLKFFYLWPLECFISACDRALWCAIKSIPFLEYSARVHWWHWSYLTAGQLSGKRGRKCSAGALFSDERLKKWCLDQLHAINNSSSTTFTYLPWYNGVL